TIGCTGATGRGTGTTVPPSRCRRRIGRRQRTATVVARPVRILAGAIMTTAITSSVTPVTAITAIDTTATAITTDGSARVTTMTVMMTSAATAAVATESGTTAVRRRRNALELEWAVQSVAGVEPPWAAQSAILSTRSSTHVGAAAKAVAPIVRVGPRMGCIS